MSSKAIAAITGVVLLIVACCLGGSLLAVGSAVAACTTPTSSPSTAPGDGWPTVGRWNPTQVGNAATIVAVGASMAVPVRGWVIAVATAMQESALTNLGHRGPGNDHDSLGLFQQRPSQGWGTPEQIMDPAHAAGQFYTRLLAVDGWQTLSLSQAAQAVQRSAAPEAYGKHEHDAIAVVAAVTGLSEQDLAACAAAGPWTQPVHGPVVSGFRTPDRPLHQGVDIAAPRGAVIRAASAGTVTRIRCNVIPASWGCDRDGNPDIVKGCGWYIEISHVENVITRYCHLLHQPAVHIGQSIAPGEPIGLVGSSGHSSGPHLHFEVHLNGDLSSFGAVDPEMFMRDRGAELGR